MNSNISLSSCDQKGSQKILNIDEFNQLYEIIGYLGEGHFGIILEVVFDDQIYALKLQKIKVKAPYDFILPTEVLVGCEAIKLQGYTNSLLTVVNYGIFHSSIISIIEDSLEDPSEIEWLSFHQGGKLPILAILMPFLKEINMYTLKRKNIIQEKNYIDIMFEILMAVVILNDNGIIHGDLNNENITYIKNKNKRQYCINGKYYLVECQIMPVIFDYGMSVFTREVPAERESYNVLLRSLSDISTILTEDDKAFFEYDIDSSIFRQVLLSDTFDELTHREINGGDNVTVFDEIIITR